MPRKASPLFRPLSSVIYLELYFYSPHDSFAWRVLYDLSLYFLVYHNNPCFTHLLREPYVIWNLLEYSSASLISFRAWWWICFIETIVLSCFTYIILRVLQNSVVISFNYDRHSRLVKKILMNVFNTMRSLILDNCFEISRW